MPTAAPDQTSTRELPRPLAPDEEELVRSLARVMYALPRAVDADMVRGQGLTLTEYTVLMHLSEAPERQMRMNELAAACEKSFSGTTRVTQRLENEGLVRRIKSKDDARGCNAVLTDAGLARLEAAWPTHLAAVRRHFLDHLAGIDLARLAQALQAVAS